MNCTKKILIGAIILPTIAVGFVAMMIGPGLAIGQIFELEPTLSLLCGLPISFALMGGVAGAVECWISKSP